MAITSMCCRSYHVETVPCTNRTHLVLRSRRAVREACEHHLAWLKWLYAPMILHESDQQSVRKIAGAVHRLGLGDKAKEPTLHWAGSLNWEVVVIKDDVVNAKCFMGGGKILIHTGLLRRLNSDAEIAAVLAHEVAHVIARHPSEMIIVFSERYYTRRFFPRFLAAPFFRRQEVEADYIGILLLAASGFDPHAALRVLGKTGEMPTPKSMLNKIRSFFFSPSTHPPCEERLRFLSRPKVMEEAMELYTQAISEGQQLTEGATILHI